MLIVSKFHDYYDRVMGSGIDKTIVYERSRPDQKDCPVYPKEVFGQRAVDTKYRSIFKVVAELNELDATWREFGPLYQDVWAGLVLFCGKLYPYIRHVETFKSKKHEGKFINFNCDNVYYSFESYKQDSSLFGLRTRLSDVSASNKFQPRADKHIEWYFDSVNDVISRRADQIRQYAIDNNIVVGVIDKSLWEYGDDRSARIYINERLENIQFAKAVDPYTAYQEIMMYISGVIGSPARPLVQISDKDQIVSKGFDLKTSFRRAPTKRKAK